MAAPRGGWLAMNGLLLVGLPTGHAVSDDDWTEQRNLVGIAVTVADIVVVMLILAWQFRQNAMRMKAQYDEEEEVLAVERDMIITSETLEAQMQKGKKSIGVVTGRRSEGGHFDLGRDPWQRGESIMGAERRAKIMSLTRISSKRRSFKGVGVEIGTSPHSWKEMLTLGFVQAIALPGLIFEKLGGRLGHSAPRWRAWFSGGGPMIWLTMAAWYIPLELAKHSAVVASVAIGCWFMTIVTFLWLFLSASAHDREWTDIDDFLAHRKLRKNGKNGLALATSLFALFQLVSLTIRVLPFPPGPKVSLSSYDVFKIKLKRLFATALFEFDILEAPDIDYFLVGFYMSVGCVFLWWLLFGGIMNKIVRSSDFSGGGESIKRRFSLYFQLNYVWGSYFIFTLLSDTCLISIISNLVKMMDCTVNAVDGATVNVTLDSKPDWLCWSDSSPQARLSTLALLCLLFYIPSATLMAPFINADSDAIFQPTKLDIRFSSRFMLAERAGKIILSALTIFFGKYPWQLLVIQFNVFTFLWYYTETTKPCSILWMNAVRSSVFAMSAWASMCILLDVLTPVEWWPIVLLLVGFSVFGIILVRRIRLIRNDAIESNVQVVEACGRVNADAAVFDDTASLRGFSHRLMGLHVWIAANDSDHRIAALQSIYVMDGVVMETPRHESGFMDSAGYKITSTRIQFNDDELLVGLSLLFEPGTGGSAHGSGAVGLKLITCTEGSFRGKTRTVPSSVGHASNGLLSAETSMVEEVCHALHDVESQRVVAFHGEIGYDGVHQLGTVTEKRKKPLAFTRACSMFATASGASMRRVLLAEQFQYYFGNHMTGDAIGIPNEMTFGEFGDWLEAGSSQAKELMESWAIVDRFVWNIERMTTYVRYTECGAEAVAVGVRGEENFGPDNSSGANVKKLDSLSIFSENSVKGMMHLEVEVKSKGTCMIIGLGKASNFAEGQEDYGNAIDPEGDVACYLVMHTEAAPTTGLLMGKFATASGPVEVPVSYGNADKIGMLVDRKTKMMCFLKNGALIPDSWVYRLPDESTDLRVIALLDAGGDRLALRNLPVTVQHRKLILNPP